MSDKVSYSGDLLLGLNIDNDWDINFENGQPSMTDGFETAVLGACFGEPDFWQNDLTNDPSEKYISEFPAIVAAGRVNSETLKNGISALRKALKWFIDIGAAESVTVDGGVLNVYALYWTVEIFKGENVGRFQINWEKGVIEVVGAGFFGGPFVPKKANYSLVTSAGVFIVTSLGDQIVVEDKI